MTATGPAFERWQDLLPTEAPGEQPDVYAQLTPEQLADLAMLVRMVRLLQAGKADAQGAMAQSADRLREAFSRNGLDADWLLSQREHVRQDRIRRSRNPNVDGQPVRLLGIALPLSLDEHAGASELLLTSTVGKCSHMPPPPYNQVAQIGAATPIDVIALAKAQGTPDPWVWVEGTIRYGLSTHRVYRVDGVTRIEAAYSIEPVRIVAASAADLARHVERTRQELKR